MEEHHQLDILRLKSLIHGLHNLFTGQQVVSTTARIMLTSKVNGPVTLLGSRRGHFIAANREITQTIKRISVSKATIKLNILCTEVQDCAVVLAEAASVKMLKIDFARTC